ncbi:hypothetical protein HRI_004054800 [Hibiscus trionum]|uniref:Uncharacterized protein n=1 Tax=Hibiscus trionum TaxID=183268 RepID=A0A9W7IXS2_HIBTR|nr:hypothetical protein HRI_004054800 [Hibiscus trionum]
MDLVSMFLEILKKPTIGDILSEVVIFIAPIWVAVIVGVLVGWSWKAKWENMGREMLIDCSDSKHSTPESSDSSSTSFDDLAQKDSFSLPPTLDSNSSS